MLKTLKTNVHVQICFSGLGKNCQQQFSRASTYGHKAFEIAAECECARLAFDKNRLSNSKAICLAFSGSRRLEREHRPCMRFRGEIHVWAL